jgi:hypothetical protein
MAGEISPRSITINSLNAYNCLSDAPCRISEAFFMAITSEVIRNQYNLRKNKELASEKQLINFLTYSLKDNLLADYNAKRRLVAQTTIETMDRIKRAKIEVDTSLNLDNMQKLRYKFSAKNSKQLADALDAATKYEDICAISESARARGLHDLADTASGKAIQYGEKNYLNDPDYQNAVKAVRRAVAYTDSGFYVPDLDRVMSVDKPRLVPIKDMVLEIIGKHDDTDVKIADAVAESIGELPDVLTPDLRRTLNELDK